MIGWIRSYFDKKRADEKRAAHQALLTHMVDEGWRSWDRHPPRDRMAVWVLRPEWLFPQLLNPQDMSPEMNVAGLYWKPWGI